MPLFLKPVLAALLVVSAVLSHPPAILGQALTFTTLAGPEGGRGFEDGTGSAARFSYPSGVATDSSGNVYVADTYNHTIRKITPAGAVTTLAGLAGAQGSADGAGSAARFYGPSGVATDSIGNVYVADTYNHTIRKITPAGAVTTLAGLVGNSGSGDGTGSAARFYRPEGVATDSIGNVYVADRSNDTIRKITPSGAVTTFAGLAGNGGRADGAGSEARFNGPAGLAIDAEGNIYVADRNNDLIRKITPAGVVTTLAGSGSSGSEDGTGSGAEFSAPMGVAVDRGGNVYVADWANQTIRKITASGEVTTLAGLVGRQGGADGTGAAARFLYPQGIAVDGNGNIYIADSENNAIRKASSALSDAATISEDSVKVGSTSVLDTAPQTATSWEWSVIRRPATSTASLSATTVRNPTFTADISGLYQLRVIASGTAGSSITVVSLQAADPPVEGRRRPVRR